MPKKADAEIHVSMAVDVDGAPNAYGPAGKPTLDYLANAHEGADLNRPVVGFLTQNDDGRTPVVQGPGDPFPGYYISTTGYSDAKNLRKEDPRKYVNAAEINYTLLAKAASERGVRAGDFCVVHSLRTNLVGYAIVGDTGNSSGAEGSLALLQRLGYNVKDGKAGGEDSEMIVVRYFRETNPQKQFFIQQSDLEAMARTLDLDVDFSGFHAGVPGTLVLVAVGNSPVTSNAANMLPFAPLADLNATPRYPGHIIALGASDSTSVKLIQARLRDLGYLGLNPIGPQPLSVDGRFGQDTEDAVELFQDRNGDANGRPLEVDGKVGVLTWAALFGAMTEPSAPASSQDNFSGETREVAGG